MPSAESSRSALIALAHGAGRGCRSGRSVAGAFDRYAVLRSFGSKQPGAPVAAGKEAVLETLPDRPEPAVRDASLELVAVYAVLQQRLDNDPSTHGDPVGVEVEGDASDFGDPAAQLVHAKVDGGAGEHLGGSLCCCTPVSFGEGLDMGDRRHLGRRQADVAGVALQRPDHRSGMASSGAPWLGLR